MFPTGMAGSALLVLRVLVAATLVANANEHGVSMTAVTMYSLLAVPTICLCLGLFTPYFQHVAVSCSFTGGTQVACTSTVRSSPLLSAVSSRRSVRGHTPLTPAYSVAGFSLCHAANSFNLSGQLMLARNPPHLGGVLRVYPKWTNSTAQMGIMHRPNDLDTGFNSIQCCARHIRPKGDPPCTPSTPPAFS